MIFVFGSYEFLAMLKGYIKETLYFKIESGKITVQCVVMSIESTMRLFWLSHLLLLKTNLFSGLIWRTEFGR